MKILIAVFCFALLLVAFFAMKQTSSYKHFQKHSKPGDKCRFYLGDEKHYGEIINRLNDVTQVRDSYDNKEHTLLTLDTYPV